MDSQHFDVNAWADIYTMEEHNLLGFDAHTTYGYSQKKAYAQLISKITTHTLKKEVA